MGRLNLTGCGAKAIMEHFDHQGNAMALTRGSQLDSCEILELLGAGGMGEVYRGRDTNLGRDVAVKALPDIFARDAERVARFEREAQVLAAFESSKHCSHP